MNTLRNDVHGLSRLVAIAQTPVIASEAIERVSSGKVEPLL